MAEGKVPKTSKELQNAIYDDFKRKAIDDAKKRAVGQHVDYETFKNMVSVAHLRPLGAPSIRHKMDQTMLPAWQLAPDGTRATQADEALVSSSALPTATPTTPPSTPGDFEREWRRNCKSDEDKYKYLRLCTPEVLSSIFKVEVSADILGGILQALDACWLSFAAFAEEDADGSALAEAAFVVSTLEALSGAGRFSLTVRLLGGKVKEASARLFGNLGDAAQAAESREGVDPAVSADNLARIKALYGVK